MTSPLDHHLDELLPGDASYESVTSQISEIVLTRPVTRGWVFGFLIGFLLLNVLLVSIGWLFAFGVGIWGINIPVAWGFAIVNFVWWIGIGHAGTLISAILLLLHQNWRTSINRFAEAMTLFAVACAGLFPLLHLGRPKFFYWLVPYPATTGVWPQFRSPLVWDFFAVSTYGTVSLLFWYLGLVPDLATMRDRATQPWKARAFGVLALGWRNSVSHWQHFQKAYVLLAGIATPLVVSVHTTVSWDFCVGIVPAWHSTVFPPYFVGGAIFCGFAMVLVITIPLRRYYGLKSLVTARHLDNMAKVMLAAGLSVSYGYLMDSWGAWYKNEPFDSYIYANRFSGPYAGCYWGLVFCNCIVPQALWFPSVRRNTLALFAISLVINVGMWLERFIIISISLHRDYMPSSWEMYYPTAWDWATLCGHVRVIYQLVVFIPPAVAGDLDDGNSRTRPRTAGGWRMNSSPATIQGVLAEFAGPEELTRAAEDVCRDGYQNTDAFTPFPMPEIGRALGRGRTPVGWYVLAGGILGGSGIFSLALWISASAYPINVGGRPLNSWPSFIPPTFEGTVLGASFAAVLSVLFLSRLPQLHHPVFEVERFRRASTDAFFLWIAAEDAMFDSEKVQARLRELGADSVWEVRMDD